jgi:hypothetical protein
MNGSKEAENEPTGEMNGRKETKELPVRVVGGACLPLNLAPALLPPSLPPSALRSLFSSLSPYHPPLSVHLFLHTSTQDWGPFRGRPGPSPALCRAFHGPARAATGIRVSVCSAFPCGARRVRLTDPVIAGICPAGCHRGQAGCGAGARLERAERRSPAAAAASGSPGPGCVWLRLLAIAM